MRILLIGSLCLLTCSACNNNSTPAEKSKPAGREMPAPLKKESVTYRRINGKDTVKQFLGGLDATQRSLVAAVNRTDSAHLGQLDSLIAPQELQYALWHYSPFPQSVPALADVQKIIFFSYPAQFFAAYEYGVLKYTGPTNMGRQKDPTPTGLYYCNWKAEKTTSTFNDEWELKWNFNIQNKEGIGFHQYELPGYPASHSCLRLNEADAKTLYQWADQWVLKGTDDVQAKGTPVIVSGSYPFGQAKPWMQLAADPKALDISVAQLEQSFSDKLSEIKAAQEQRAALPATGSN